MNTIRDNFYRDLILEYTNEGEQSFLYRYFWADSISGLLEEHFPGLSLRRIPRPKDGRRIREKLARVLEKNPGRAADKLLKKTSKGNRRNFWEELWLNDAGYLAGLVENRDYYLWLVEYLEARDIYYKDTSMWDQRDCLGTLLQAGLRDEKKTFEPGCRERKSDTKKGTEGESLFTTAQLKRDLADLAEKLRREHEAGGTEISDRLRSLKRRVGTKKGEKPADYLLWLTSRLERMALHIRIKTWLQDSGYPMVKPKDGEEAKAEPFKTGLRRKRDFSMRLFEAYCSSSRGYEIRKKDPGGAAAPNGWRLNHTGFCMLDLDQIRALQTAMEGNEETFFNIPLAVDLYSGCVFFLAGKGLYEALYRQEEEERKKAYEIAKNIYDNARRSREELERIVRMKELKKDFEDARNAYINAKSSGEKLERRVRMRLKKDFEDAGNAYESAKTSKEEQRMRKLKKDFEDAKEAYETAKTAKEKFDKTPERFCFDYSRLDEAHLEQFPGDVRGAFRMRPNFHENAGKSCEILLNEFLWYCERGEDSPRARVREFNREQPAGIPDPYMFLWAFDSLPPKAQRPVKN